jgi:Zn finger protein HypA/HybF involved in hydrogenase expression
MILERKLDVSHFTGITWNKGLTSKDHSGIAAYADKNKADVVFDINTKPKNARKYYVRERKENKTYFCDCCRIEDWQDKPLVLQLEHKSGDNTDNRKENLELLCPNCHSQTETWGSKRGFKDH